MGRLTDTHCHLNLNVFRDDLPELLERAWQQGLARILIPGIDMETSQSAVKLAEQHENLYAAVGVHPGSASAWDESSLAALRDLTQHPKAVALGEIGLDYYRDRSPRPLQRQVFREQLNLAAERGLPVVVHNRESADDLWAELSAWQAALERAGLPLAKRPGVLHSYDGPLTIAQPAIQKGFFIGVSGPVTFKKAIERQEAAANLPLDHLLIETDAPYLTPHPYRGRRNEPAYVAYVAEKLAELRQQPLDSVVKMTWENAARLFDWGANP